MKRLILTWIIIVVSFASNIFATEDKKDSKDQPPLVCHLQSDKSVQSLRSTLEHKEAGLSVSLLGVDENNYEKVEELLAPFAQQIDHLYIFQNRTNPVVTAGKIAELPIMGGLSSISFNYDLIGDTGVLFIERSAVVNNRFKGFKIELIKQPQMNPLLHEWITLFPKDIKLAIYYKTKE